MIKMIGYVISHDGAWINLRSDKFIEPPEDEELTFLDIMGIHYEREGNDNIIRYEFFKPQYKKKYPYNMTREIWILHYQTFQLIMYGKRRDIEHANAKQGTAFRGSNYAEGAGKYAHFFCR